MSSSILVALAGNAWRFRYAIAVLTVLGSILGSIFAVRFPVSEARTYIRFQFLPQEFYRQAKFKLSDSSVLRHCLQDGVKTAVDAPLDNHFNLMVTQVHPAARSAPPPPPDQRGVVLIIAKSGDPNIVGKQVLSVAACVNQIIGLTGLRDVVASRQREIGFELVKQLTLTTKLSQEIDSQIESVNGLRELSTKYPVANVTDWRQVVDVRGEASFHTPLPQQIVAAEAQIVAKRQQLVAAESQGKVLELLAKYYELAAGLPQEFVSQQNVLEQLQVLRGQIFTSDLLKNPLFSDALSTLQNTERIQISEYTGQVGSIDFQPKFGKLRGAFFGLLVAFVVAVLLLALATLRRNYPTVANAAGD